MIDSILCIISIFKFIENRENERTNECKTSGELSSIEIKI